MTKVKLAVIYYSATGTNYQLAKWAAASAEKAGAEVKIARVKETAPESSMNDAMKKHAQDTKDVETAGNELLEWADAIIFSVPTRYGNMPAQMKAFLDGTGQLWFQGKLTNKVVSAMTSAQNPHGGQEQTILSLYTTMYHWGAIVVAPGYTDKSIFGAGGNPYGTSVSVDDKGKMKEDVQAAVEHQAKRVVEIAGMISGGTKK